MKALQISNYTITTALGRGRAENLEGLLAEKSALQPCRFFDITDLDAWIGEVREVDEQPLSSSLEHFECRNNRLSAMALEQDDFVSSVERAKARYGAARIGVFVGTSTAGIHQTEKAYISRTDNDMPLPSWYRYETTHNIYSTSEFVRQYLGLEGVSSAISTACSSSAKVFASAARAIEAGWCDAAVVGGVDSLCLTTIYGFNSLQLVSSDMCRPSDKSRSGISIGEAGGFALIEKQDGTSPYGLLGYGESSDAYHMSSPHPEGEGASLAMKAALRRAELGVDDIDYINLHGTGTRANDLAEAKAVASLFASKTPCSSTKGWTGHTLGAAGIVEAGLCLMSLDQSVMPKSLNTLEIDPDIDIPILMQSKKEKLKNTLSNSFGFGGSNCVLILGELH